MPTMKLMNPFRCRMWKLHDRLDAHINEATCRAEIASFEGHGQLVAVLGRTLQGDGDHDVELITGARRLFVARHLNQPLMVELRTLTDKEALIAMDSESRLRKDISPYERALSYARWLRSGFFKSQDDIARALKVSPSQVSRILKLAQLPAVVVQAFANPTEIREEWGRCLLTILEDRAGRQALLDTARAVIAKPDRLPAHEVYRQLLHGAAQGRKLKIQRHDVVVRGADGSALFRIRHLRDTVALLLPLENVGERALRDISEAVAAVLRAGSAQVNDSGRIAGSKLEVKRAARRAGKRARHPAEDGVQPAPT
jgi:ParB family chromosome partitioning protein